ncbi:hypothetical protein DL96DRAFT_1579983 [Flagelloscypha sp. PMI_526]|nr:hypothetical protein DL96DRAFT_1579983 [Flagelloscypha sp. PMI_526]
MPSASIQDVPTEVMRFIFLCFVNEWHACLLDSESYPTPKWTDTLLGVSKLWLTVTLSCQDLWAYIVLPVTERRLDKHLELAGKVDLKLFTVGTMVDNFVLPRREKNVTKKLLNCFDRIRVLEVRPGVSGMAIFVFPSGLQSASLTATKLTYLTIDMTEDIHIISGSGYAAIRDFIERRCPCLVDFTFRWNQLLPFGTLSTTLARLDLEAYHRLERFGMCIPLKCLASLSNLVFLRLAGSYLFRLTDDKPGTIEPIVLPKLETLCLSNGSIQAIHKTRMAITGPALLNLDFGGTTCDRKYTPFSPFNDIWMSVHPHIRDTVDELSIEVDEKRITVYWSRKEASRTSPVSIRCRVEFQMGKDLTVSQALQGLSSALTSCRLSRLEMIFINFGLFSAHQWPPVFRPLDMSLLEELPLVKGSSAASLELIQEMSTKGDSSGAERLLFPSLKTLIFNRWDFSRFDMGVFESSLRAAFVKRRQCGAGAVTLRLRRCTGLTNGDQEMLIEVLKGVFGGGESKEYLFVT